MAIALVGTPTKAIGSSTTATTVTISVPSGSVGDLIIFNVACGATSSVDAPLITASTSGLTTLWSVDDTLLATKVFYRFVQSGDPTSYTFTLNTGTVLAVECVRYSGVSSTTPFRFVNVTDQGSDNATTFTSVAFPPVDNVQSTDLTLCIVADGTAAINTTQASALSTPTGWTNVVNTLGPTGSGGNRSTHLAMAMYSKTAGTDTPAVTGTAGHIAAISVVLIDASNVVAPATGGTISFVDVTTVGQTTNTGTVVVNVPAVSDGDLMLAVMANPSGNGAWTPPSGWEALPLTNCIENQGVSGNVSDLDAQLWYRFASSEPTSYTFTCNKTNHANAGAIVAYRGLRNPYPVHILNVTKSEGSGNSSTTTSTTPFALNTMNVINSDMLVVNIYCCGSDVSCNSITVTLPGGTWNSRATVTGAVSATFNAALGIADKLGATDQPTSTASVSSGWVLYSLALVGAPLPVGAAPRSLIVPFALKRSTQY